MSLRNEISQDRLSTDFFEQAALESKICMSPSLRLHFIHSLVLHCHHTKYDKIHLFHCRNKGMATDQTKKTAYTVSFCSKERLGTLHWGWCDFSGSSGISAGVHVVIIDNRDYITRLRSLFMYGFSIYKQCRMGMSELWGHHAHQSPRKVVRPKPDWPNRLLWPCCISSCWLLLTYCVLWDL